MQGRQDMPRLDMRLVREEKSLAEAARQRRFERAKALPVDALVAEVRRAKRS